MHGPAPMQENISLKRAPEVLVARIFARAEILYFLIWLQDYVVPKFTNGAERRMHQICQILAAHDLIRAYIQVF